MLQIFGKSLTAKLIVLCSLVILCFELQPSLQHMLAFWPKSQVLSREQEERFRSELSFTAKLLRDVRINFVSPVLQILVGVSAFLSSLVAADRLFHFYVTLYWKILRIRPEDEYSATPLPDLEKNSKCYPKVVVQIPMFNEKEVCEQVIDACCELDWPRDRLRIQILDDSTCPITRQRVCNKVNEWKANGINIEDRWRSNRKGFKAGAMMEAENTVKDYDFIAIFDADFKPESNFLQKTVPYLLDNPRVAFVQARWIFANATETVLTRIQEISLNYHIKCEQFARFSTGNFFNFNGTAGVWRREAMEDAGGWNNRTTVEDMDLSLRAYLKGWRFIFLNDVVCLNEIPSSYAAFRSQQHRWSCGPMQLWRKAMAAVWASKIPFLQKIYLNFFFFGTRLFATHIVAFVFYCTLVPICILAPEVSIPFWALVYVPILVTISTVIFTPCGSDTEAPVLQSWHYVIPFVLFENAMSIVKLSAMISGLLDLQSSHSWVVTTKLGKWAAEKSMLKRTKPGDLLWIQHNGTVTATLPLVHPVATSHTGNKIQPLVKPTRKARRKVYKREICMAIFIFGSAIYGIFVESRWQYSVFLILQSLTFAAFGLNLVDAQAFDTAW